MTVGTAADTNITKTARLQHARAPLGSSNGGNTALAACKLCQVLQGVLTRTKSGNVNTGGPSPDSVDTESETAITLSLRQLISAPLVRSQPVVCGPNDTSVCVCAWRGGECEVGCSEVGRDFDGLRCHLPPGDLRRRCC